MLKTKLKKAEAYIDTVVTVFISLLIMFLAINVFSYFVTYQKLNNIGNNIIRYAAINGDTNSTEVKNKIKEYITGEGLKFEDVAVSFDGSDYIKNKTVQYGDTIALHISTSKKYSYIGKTSNSLFTLRINKIGLSESYFNGEKFTVDYFSEQVPVPDGATYKQKDGTILEYFPDIPSSDDTYEDGDYIYIYNNSDGWSETEWSVTAKVKTKSEYGVILSSIANKPVTVMENTFLNCNYLVTAPVIPNSVINMSGAFGGCTSLTTAPKIPNGVTNMNNAFRECSSLVTAPDIPNSVTEMNSAFQECSSLTSCPKFEKGGSTSLEYTFYGTKINEVSSMPSDITNLYRTFYGCTDLRQVSVDINGSVTIAEEAFAGCNNLTTFTGKLSDNIKNLHGTFDRCSKLSTKIQIPKNAENMLSTFYECSSLPGITGDIPSGVRDMRWTFYNCSSFNTLITIPSKVKNLKSTFYGCYSLVNAPNFHNAITEMEETFAQCSSLSGNLTKLPTSVKNLHGTFDRCTSMTVAPTIPNGVTNMLSTFYLCENLKTLNNKTIPATVTDMRWTFYYCSSLSDNITVNASPSQYNHCFRGTTKPITLTGSSTKLTELAATANNGNVIVK